MLTGYWKFEPISGKKKGNTLQYGSLVNISKCT